MSPYNEYSGLISFRIDWFDLLAVQGTLQSLLQHHSSKPSVLQCSTFFMVQFSHSYMTTGKTIASTRRTFVDKVMCLLLNMLSRLVITFLPRSKRLLISWLQSPSAVIAVSDSAIRSPLGSSVHGILQTRILECVAKPSSGDLPDPEMEPMSLTVSCTGRQLLYH